VGVAHGKRQDVLAREREDFLERPAFLGRRLLEEGRVRADFAEYWTGEEFLAMLRHRVRREIPQPTDFVGRKVERRALLLRPARVLDFAVEAPFEVGA
jgi:hypothetical protein